MLKKPYILYTFSVVKSKVVKLKLSREQKTKMKIGVNTYWLLSTSHNCE